MHIHVKAEDLVALSTQTSRENLTFRIFWEHNGSYYPMEDWVDFGCIIIGWWVSSLIRFQRGSSRESFTFMDGPYSIDAQFDKVSGEVELKPKGTNLVWTIKITEIAENLLQIVESLQHVLVYSNISSKDQVAFEKYSEALRESFLAS
jgi:hypothetical protein